MRGCGGGWCRAPCGRFPTIESVTRRQGVCARVEPMSFNPVQSPSCDKLWQAPRRKPATAVPCHSVGVHGAEQRIGIMVALAVLANASAATGAPPHGAVQPRLDGIAQGSAVVRRAPANDHQEATDAANQPLPGWTGPEIASIQKQLNRLGLYTFTADGNLGASTRSGLVEAFGSDE